jgi:Glycosyl transferase family 2
MARDLEVVAIVAAYNEADVIERVVLDLIDNGVSVYLIDDGSTDDTARLIEPLVGRGVVAIERIDPPPSDDAPKFSWERLLRRKAQLAAELDADWFIHHDADEFRESPWAGVPLQDAIRHVDACGYNAIDFVSLDFCPTHDHFEPGTDVRASFPFYTDAAPYDRVQIRCWKKTLSVDLASSGGHDARFENRRVFPIRFISRHYPIRGQAHGERKVFKERRERFSGAERARNWHVQYDAIPEGASFIRDACDLTRYDGEAVRMTLALRHRGVEALEAAIAESKTELGAVRQALEARTRENDALRAEVARYEDQVLQIRAAIEERTLAVAKARTQAEMRERQLAAQTLELASTRTILTDVRGRLDAFQQSWSWRVTSPARTLLRWLRGY